MSINVILFFSVDKNVPRYKLIRKSVQSGKFPTTQSKIRISRQWMWYSRVPGGPLQ